MSIHIEHDRRLGQGKSPENECAVLVEEVSVKYRIAFERVTSIKEFTIRWIQRRLHYQDHWALRDVSLDVRKGEVFGIIGRNGAGKSTLLKTVARVMRPTAGRIVTRGTVAPLLELGAGFHPELTGRENVFLNSTLLGRSRRDTKDLFEQIVDFAELWEFIDAPLRTYSTGMVARLGFAVATSVVADILIVDEVLSVGDVQFREKCMERMRFFQQQGACILLVSHNMGIITGICTRAALLSEGHLHALGPVDQVVAEYLPSN